MTETTESRVYSPFFHKMILNGGNMSGNCVFALHGFMNDNNNTNGDADYELENLVNELKNHGSHLFDSVKFNVGINFYVGAASHHEWFTRQSFDYRELTNNDDMYHSSVNFVPVSLYFEVNWDDENDSAYSESCNAIAELIKKHAEKWFCFVDAVYEGTDETFSYPCSDWKYTYETYPNVLADKVTSILLGKTEVDFETIVRAMCHVRVGAFKVKNSEKEFTVINPEEAYCSDIIESSEHFDEGFLGELTIPLEIALLNLNGDTQRKTLVESVSE